MSPASAIKSAARRSKICTAFDSVWRIDRDIRRNITVVESAAEAPETAGIAKEMARKVTAFDQFI